MDHSLEHLTPEEQEALRATFQSQALELLDAINEGLLQLEGGLAEGSVLQGLQRAIHTIKGDAGAFGLTTLVRVAHRMEDLLGAVAEGQMALDRDRLTALFQAADACEHLLRGEGDGPDPQTADVDALLDALAPAPTRPPQCGGAPGPADPYALPLTHPQPDAGRAGPGLALSEYDRLAAADAEARGLTPYLLRAEVDRRCRMVAAGAFLLLRHLQGAGEILRAEPPLEGPVPESCTAFTILLASGLAAESLERRCLLPGVVAAARAVPVRGQGIAERGGDATSGQTGPSPVADPPSAVPHPPSSEGMPGAAGTSTILVDTRRVDRVMNLVGELVIARSIFQQAFADLQARFPKADFLVGFREAHRLMDRSLADLQKGVMKIRMVPIDRVLRRLPRLVRDLTAAGTGGRDAAQAGGHADGKAVRLVLEGRATELDKGIVDALGEPLVHLIRNAVDHGIEPVEARQAAGKPPVGTVRVAARAEGNQIIIEVQDDGRGIDPAAIRRAAVAQGLVHPEAAEALSDAEALDLIFLPRLSTAAQVTDTSGRGIGMDAVRVSLEPLKGQIQVASHLGQGTTFTLRVPLTLAILRAMLFHVAGRLFALPLSTIAEIARIDPQAVRTVDGQEVLPLRERVISLIRLQDALGLPSNADCGLRIAGSGHDSGQAQTTAAIPHPASRIARSEAAGAPSNGRGRLYVLVVALADRRIGLVVDGLHGEGELVIKAMEADWVSRAPLAGAAILGDGRLVLILDPGALIERTMARARPSRAGHEAARGSKGAGGRP